MWAGQSPSRLSPDPELADERAVSLDVGVPQVVQQTPLLANQEEKAAARVVVLGMRLQVLGELPDAGGRQRDLDLGGTRVLVSALKLRDQLALDLCLYCQTKSKYTGHDHMRENRTVFPHRRVGIAEAPAPIPGEDGIS